MSYVYSRKPPMADVCKYEMTGGQTDWSIWTEADHQLGKKRKSEIKR